MASSVISVIGGAGHVGLPFSLVCAKAGHKVYAIDLALDKIEKLQNKEIPFTEEGALETLEEFFQNITFTTSYESIPISDYVVIMIGAPLDEESNPRIDGLFELFKGLHDKFKTDATIILRSTVPIGTTAVLKDKYPKLNIVFAPERVAQGQAIKETTQFPQLIGAFNDDTCQRAAELFLSLGVPECLHLTPEEAECGKLITNMYRYINFAFANQLYIQTIGKNINLNKVIEAANKGYPRMNMSYPGFAAGYCLSKDGMLLLTEGELGTEMISAARNINEGMPLMISQLIPKDAKVLILGAAFKANSDDTRLSLSFKLKKALTLRGIEYKIYDPLVPGYQEYPQEYNPNVLVVMTPHKEFENFTEHEYLKHRSGTLMIIDIWKHLLSSKNKTNGIYYV